MMLKLFKRILIVQLVNQLMICNVQNVEIVNNLKDTYLLSGLFSNFKNSLNSSNESFENETVKNELSSEFFKFQRDFLKQDLVQRLFEQIESNKEIISSACFDSLNEYRASLEKGSVWAFKMYDSSCRQINQLLDGTFLNLGDFQQCLNIKSDQTGDYVGRYFLFNLVPQLKYKDDQNGITLDEFKKSNQNLESRLAFLFKFPDLINIKLGICLPKNCSNNEIQTVFNKTVNKFNWKIYKEINSQINQNLWSKLRSSNRMVKISFFIITVILAFVFISTILDFNFRKDQSTIYSFIESTSIRSNFLKLHSCGNDRHKNNFISKNRHYSEIMVNISHFVVFVPLLGASVVYERIFDWLEYSDKSYFQFWFSDCYYPGLIILASITVSMKMLMSEFSLFKKEATGQEFILNAIKRMINFWPILIFLISLQIIMPIFLEGPLVLELIQPLARNCERNWLLNLLFIHNILPLENTCLSYTWTISVEIQLYLIASLLTYLYIKRPKLALFLNISLIVIGVFSNFYVSYFGFTNPNVVFFPFNYHLLRRSIFYSHSNTFVQLSPYFTIFLAFYLRLTKRSFKLSISNELLITLILLIYVITTFHSSLIFNVFNVKPRPILNAIYFLYNRSSFTLLFAWLILQYYPNGTASKKEEIKDWFKQNLLRKKINVIKDANRSEQEIKNDTKNIINRKVSSIESTSDLSDYSIQTDLLDNQISDKNNNTSYDFYNRKLINFDEEDKMDNQKSELIYKSVIIDEKLDKKLNKKTNENNTKELNKRFKISNLEVWIKLSRSIYYSHFFYLIYSLFNVNNAQKSDFLSVVISVQSKLFWAYIFAYLFHLLIEGAITNLTNKLIQKITIEKTHKD